VPTFWAEAGAVPYNNIIGPDPGLRDPEQGDFHADIAVGYGCRIFDDTSFNSVRPASSTLVPRQVVMSASGMHRTGRLDVGGVIDKDTTWDAALVRVTDGIEIIDGAVLTIAPGVRIEFSGFWGLTVHDGSLQAIGTPLEPIVWTSERNDLWEPDLQTLGAWNGLTFRNVPAARDSSRLRWCALECSKALPPDIGGAVRVTGGSPLVISHSVLSRNLAERGGAVATHYGASPLLVNNLFHDNHALLRGAGIYASNSYPVLVHNTFTANVTAGDTFHHTGCVDHAHAKPLHIGGIVWGNPTGHYGNTQIRGGKAYYTRFCNVEDWLGGEGCLSDHPMLDDAGNPPYAPLQGSPVIDAGSADAAAPWLPHLDLAGRQRILGPAPDIGAFEVMASTSAPPTVSLGPILSSAPNPFNPQTILTWSQERAGPALLRIFDARGRLVRTLIDAELRAGSVRLVWDGTDASSRRMPAGIYLARLHTPDGTTGLKLVLVP
jgi:hypothetical protein